MGSAGDTYNVATNPVGAKTLLPAETIAPNQLDMRNAVRTDVGHFKGRPGYQLEWSTGLTSSVISLMPFRRASTDGLGFALMQSGAIVELLASNATQVYTGALNTTVRPNWDVFDGIPIVVSGQTPIKIRVDQAFGNNNTEVLGGSPPAARFISVIADRVILSGQNDTQFNWSEAGNAEIWPAINFSNVTGHGQRIVQQFTKDTELYFWKNYDVEVWSHIGGDEVFGRSGIITILDKHRCERGIQGESIILAGDPARFFFYADGDFWTLNGTQPQRISLDYKREIGNIPNVDGIYGFDFAKEHVIRWYEPVSGRCFVYDYRNQIFTEDNLWVNGAWERMPIFAYMEMQDRAFIGDFNPTGNIYEWDDDLDDDNGTPIRIYRKMRILLDPKTNHACRFNRLRLRMQRGDGALGTAPTLQVRWAFDGSDFTPNQSLSMGEATSSVGEHGNYNPYVDLYNLGVGKEVLLEVVQYAGVPHLMTHLTVTARKLGR